MILQSVDVPPTPLRLPRHHDILLKFRCLIRVSAGPGRGGGQRTPQTASTKWEAMALRQHYTDADVLERNLETINILNILKFPICSRDELVRWT